MSDRPRETAVPLVRYAPMRGLVLRLRRAEAAAERAQERLAQTRAEYAEAEAAVLGPLGLSAGVGPLHVEALARVVVDGDHWLWTGNMNNKGTATIRRWGGGGRALSTEVSASRVIHGAIAPDHEPPGAMQPRCALGNECVRPAHRCPTCEVIAESAGT